MNKVANITGREIELLDRVRLRLRNQGFRLSKRRLIAVLVQAAAGLSEDDLVHLITKERAKSEGGPEKSNGGP